jgi:hypothetical protein
MPTESKPLSSVLCSRASPFVSSLPYPGCQPPTPHPPTSQMNESPPVHVEILTMLAMSRLASRTTTSSTEISTSSQTTKRVRDSASHDRFHLAYDLVNSPHSAPSANSRCLSHSRSRDISPKLNMLAWHANRCDQRNRRLGR